MVELSAVRWEVAPNGVGTITFNRPHERNTFNRQTCYEIYSLIEGPARHESIKVVVLTGEGTFFCPGAGAAEDRSTPPPPEQEGLPTGYLTALLRGLPATTIAAVNGAVAGAGLSLACACDLRVAARGAVFRTGFLNVGVAGDFGLPWTLTRLVGLAKAKELSILCERFGADEAQRIGLVARVWDDDAFREEAQKLIDGVAASAPLALLALKQNYQLAERMDLMGFLDFEHRKVSELLRTEDSQEAFRAFLEKRTPQFKGR